jgi:serine phosphatase RsbU (regulator of sigma subunit)
VQGSPTQIPAEDENAADGKKIALAAVPWLDRVTGPAVSNYMSVPDVTGDDAGGFNLICVPELPVRRPPQQPPGSPPRPIQRLLVAVIPANDVGRRFMPVTDPPSTNLRALADATLTTIATSNPGMAGENLLQSADPAVRQLTADFAQSPRENSLFVQQSIEVEGRELGPRLITVEPITIGGNHWCLVVTSSLAEMEAGMNSVFRRVLFWGAFVVISITMIMVSTAAQLIRTRARLEHVQNAMLTRELSQAREIQLKWLPHASTSPHGIDIAAVNQPASHISGDFYNWFELPDGRIVVAIGDVTGHGMSAAFLMATTQLLVRNTIARTGDPGPCLREVNEQLSVQVFHGQFVSLLLLVLDLKNGVMDIADAGHPPPLIDVGGKFETLPVKSQLVLGVEHGVEYPTQRLPLPPDATLVLYTDGVVDAMTRQSQRFTLAGLQKSLASAPRGSRKMIDAILDGVNQHLAGQPLDDDLTLVVIRLQPSAAAIPAPAKIG